VDAVVPVDGGPNPHVLYSEFRVEIMSGTSYNYNVILFFMLSVKCDVKPQFQARNCK